MVRYGPVAFMGGNIRQNFKFSINHGCLCILFNILIMLGIDFLFMPGLRATSGSGEAQKIF